MVTEFPRYRTTTVSASFRHTTTVSNARATCRSLKYYNKFASCVRSLVPHNTSRGSFLNLPASSCFILRPSPLHSVFAVEQLLLARWLHVRCFLSLPLTLPTQCVRLPWNVAESSETSCRVVQGSSEACRLNSLVVALSAANCARLKCPVASPRMMRQSCSQWLGVSFNLRQVVVRSRQSEGCGQHTRIQRFASRHQPMQALAHEFQMCTKKKNYNNETFQTYSSVRQKSRRNVPANHPHIYIQNQSLNTINASQYCNLDPSLVYI